MVNYCCVPGCKNQSYPGSRFSYHGFPKDENKKLKWINAVPTNLKLLKSHVICSVHFKCDDFVPGCIRNLLKPDAVPSIFPENTYLINYGSVQCERLHDEKKRKPDQNNVAPLAKT